MILIRLGGIFDYNCSKEPLRNHIGNYLGYSKACALPDPRLRLEGGLARHGVNGSRVPVGVCVLDGDGLLQRVDLAFKGRQKSEREEEKRQ